MKITNNTKISIFANVAVGTLNIKPGVNPNIIFDRNLCLALMGSYTPESLQFEPDSSMELELINSLPTGSSYLKPMPEEDKVEDKVEEKIEEKIDNKIEEKIEDKIEEKVEEIANDADEGKMGVIEAPIKNLDESHQPIEEKPKSFYYKRS